MYLLPSPDRKASGLCWRNEVRYRHLLLQRVPTSPVAVLLGSVSALKQQTKNENVKHLHAQT